MEIQLDKPYEGESYAGIFSQLHGSTELERSMFTEQNIKRRGRLKVKTTNTEKIVSTTESY